MKWKSESNDLLLLLFLLSSNVIVIPIAATNTNMNLLVFCILSLFVVVNSLDDEDLAARIFVYKVSG